MFVTEREYEDMRGHGRRKHVGHIPVVVHECVSNGADACVLDLTESKNIPLKNVF